MPMPSSAAHIDADAQYGAYSQNGDNGALRRYAQVQLPKVQQNLKAPASSPAAASASLDRGLRPSRHATKPRLRKAQAGHSPQPWPQSCRGPRSLS